VGVLNSRFCAGHSETIGGESTTIGKDEMNFQAKREWVESRAPGLAPLDP